MSSWNKRKSYWPGAAGSRQTMLPQLRPPVDLFPESNLSGRVMPYMPTTLAGAAPQKVMVTVPPGATCEGSAITL